ncbi:MAG: signal peptidase I [Clostridia bacterium]|nr:signal peptidase I [Clostridia bacterium]
MNATLKKIWNVFTTVLVALVVLCAVFLMGSRLLGFQVFTVISGSMEPAYGVGDLLYVKKVDVNSIKVGDPITFILNEDLVVATHRVVRIDAENSRFYTKGDANEIEDSEPVHFKNVIGVPRFSIPKLGYVSDFIQNPPGTYIAIALGAILIILVFLPDLLPKKKEQEKMADENEKLKAELEALKEQISQETEKIKAESLEKTDETAK